MEDIELIRESQQGRNDYFGQLYDRYIERIFQFVYFRTHHKQTAEDITAVVFMKALERIKQYDPSRASFSGWLYQIARNAVIDHYRSMRATEPIESIWDLADDADVARDVEMTERLSAVRKHMEKLSPEQRSVIIMRLWDGLSYKEIAESLGKTEASCKMAYMRGIKKIIDLSALIMLLFHIKNVLLS